VLVQGLEQQLVGQRDRQRGAALGGVDSLPGQGDADRAAQPAQVEHRRAAQR
jgi:hypothetical protein